MEAVEVDDVGSPVASDWLLKAFGSGEATKRRYRCPYNHESFFWGGRGLGRWH